VANEAKLKMEEMPLVSSNVYYSLEFFHGQMSMGYGRRPVVGLVPDTGLAEEPLVLDRMRELSSTHTVVLFDQ